MYVYIMTKVWQHQQIRTTFFKTINIIITVQKERYKNDCNLYSDEFASKLAMEWCTLI